MKEILWKKPTKLKAGSLRKINKIDNKINQTHHQGKKGEESNQ